MGASYVTMGWNADGRSDIASTQTGFWMRDGWLELWLRLLALHIEDPIEDRDQAEIARRIRDQWLLASQGHFNGCVPHGLEEVASSETGRSIVRNAVGSLSLALKRAPERLSPAVLQLLGIPGDFKSDIEAEHLRVIGQAFSDLLDGQIKSVAGDNVFVPPR